jgi:alpha,alpha-trehalose phosphorylase
MYFPTPREGIWPQDEGFLDRQPWPLDSIPEEKRPLLLHFHPLDIYRRRICKQADLILAMTVFGEMFTPEEKERNFDFYDSVTTHDSSLSKAVFSILADEIGREDKAYDYFAASARLDLDDTYRNTKDGLHMANMAGTWNCLVRGFGGMRLKDGMLYFNPKCPDRWESCAFCVRFRGRLLRVRMDRAGGTYELLRGEPITILTPAGELLVK